MELTKEEAQNLNSLLASRNVENISLYLQISEGLLGNELDLVSMYLSNKGLSNPFNIEGKNFFCFLSSEKVEIGSNIGINFDIIQEANIEANIQETAWDILSLRDDTVCSMFETSYTSFEIQRYEKGWEYYNHDLGKYLYFIEQ